MKKIKRLTDREIVEKIIERDAVVTHWFFHVKCRPLFLSLIKKFFNYPVNYDEFVNEVVILLLENGENRLRGFDYRSSIYLWLRTCLLRYFVRNGKVMIEDKTKESLSQMNEKFVDTAKEIDDKIDLEFLMSVLKKENPRHEYVIRRLIFEGAEYEEVAEEIDVLVSNLYNIKKRALRDLTEIALDLKK